MNYLSALMRDLLYLWSVICDFREIMFNRLAHISNFHNMSQGAVAIMPHFKGKGSYCTLSWTLICHRDDLLLDFPSVYSQRLFSSRPKQSEISKLFKNIFLGYVIRERTKTRHVIRDLRKKQPVIRYSDSPPHNPIFNYNFNLLGIEKKLGHAHKTRFRTLWLFLVNFRQAHVLLLFWLYRRLQWYEWALLEDS